MPEESFAPVFAKISGAILALFFLAAAPAQAIDDTRQLGFEIFKELVELNTVTATGDTGASADAMAARLRAGGFAENDIKVFKPIARKGNLVARLRGNGSRT